MRNNIILKNKNVIYLVIILVIAVLFLKTKKFIFWSILSLIASLIKYFRMRYYGHIPIVYEPTLFTATIITRTIGIKWSILFLIGPNLFSEIMSGGFNISLINSISMFILFQVLSLFMISYSILFVGLVLCILDIIQAFLINIIIYRFPIFLLFYNITENICNIIYFSLFGEAIMIIYNTFL
jgi:hypothetical protein